MPKLWRAGSEGYDHLLLWGRNKQGVQVLFHLWTEYGRNIEHAGRNEKASRERMHLWSKGTGRAVYVP